MNKEWAEANRLMQQQLKKESTFQSGINTLFCLRNSLFEQLLLFKSNLSNARFCEMPFANAKGYHNKTIAYSLWHTFRIEDIVAHTVIKNDEQVFFCKCYQNKINSPIITTGNELVKDEIVEFSKQLDIDALYEYISEVKNSTEAIIKKFSFDDVKQKISPEAKDRIIKSHSVSADENAVWLIDYWCGKTIRGLIQMPFSRHWIMHTEAALKIANKVKSNEYNYQKIKHH